MSDYHTPQQTNHHDQRNGHIAHQDDSVALTMNESIELKNGQISKNDMKGMNLQNQDGSFTDPHKRSQSNYEENSGGVTKNSMGHGGTDFKNTTFFSTNFNSLLDFTVEGGQERAKQMLLAKQQKEEKAKQMLQLEARIKKLEKENEKARLRISDAKRQQDFVRNIKFQKLQHNEAKHRYFSQIRIEEENARRQISQDREERKKSIQNTITTQQNRNWKIGNEIREQKKRIQQTIEQNRSAMIQEKQRSATQNKQTHLKMMNQTLNSKKNFFTNTQKFYLEKVNQHQNDTGLMEKKMKELEKKEQEMLSKLQHTYQTEQKEIGKLQAFKRMPTKQYESNTSQVNVLQEYDSVTRSLEQKDLKGTIEQQKEAL